MRYLARTPYAEGKRYEVEAAAGSFDKFVIPFQEMRTLRRDACPLFFYAPWDDATENAHIDFSWVVAINKPITKSLHGVFSGQCPIPLFNPPRTEKVDKAVERLIRNREPRLSISKFRLAYLHNT